MKIQFAMWESVRAQFEDRVETRWRKAQRNEIEVICDEQTADEITAAIVATIERERR